jgi:hypothetical protein
LDHFSTHSEFLPICVMRGEKFQIPQVSSAGIEFPNLALRKCAELVARDVEDPSINSSYIPQSLILPSLMIIPLSSISKMATSKNPDIILYFLQSSRSIRIAWLLEELKLPYKSIFFPRENNKAPSDFKEKSGNTLGKALSLRDGRWWFGRVGPLVS